MRLHVEWDNSNGVRIWRWKLYVEVETQIPTGYSEHLLDICFMEGESEFHPGEAYEDTIVRIARGIKAT